jgi:hypothetical protein
LLADDVLHGLAQRGGKRAVGNQNHADHVRRLILSRSMPRRGGW